MINKLKEKHPNYIFEENRYKGIGVHTMKVRDKASRGYISLTVREETFEAKGETIFEEMVKSLEEIVNYVRGEE